MAADEAFTSLNLLHGNKDDWKVRVKVFMLWPQTYLNNPTHVASWDMILIDHEGNKIVASIKNFLMLDFVDSLKEGNHLELTNFGVGPYKGKFLLVQHEWKINFCRTTKVKRCPSFEVATYIYNLMSFDDVLEWRVLSILAFDVVGHLVSLKAMRIKRESGKESKSIEFVLQDVAGKKIQCALWGDYAKQLHDFVSKNKHTSYHIIVFIHNGKIKEWERKPHVSNQLFDSRVYINYDVTSIQNFKAGLLTNDAVDLKQISINRLSSLKQFKSHCLLFQEMM